MKIISHYKTGDLEISVILCDVCGTTFSLIYSVNIAVCPKCGQREIINNQPLTVEGKL